MLESQTIPHYHIDAAISTDSPRVGRGTFFAIPVPPLARQIWNNSRHTSSSNNHRRSLESVSDHFGSSGASLIHFSSMRHEARSSSSVCDPTEHVQLNSVDNPLHEEEHVGDSNAKEDVRLHSNTYRPQPEVQHPSTQFRSPTTSECESQSHISSAQESSASSSSPTSGNGQTPPATIPTPYYTSVFRDDSLHVRLAQKHRADQQLHLTSAKNGLLQVMHHMELLVCSMEDHLGEVEGKSKGRVQLAAALGDLNQLLSAQRQAMSQLSSAEREGAMIDMMFRQQLVSPTTTMPMQNVNVKISSTPYPQQPRRQREELKSAGVNAVQPIWMSPPPLGPSSTSPATPRLSSPQQLCSSLHQSTYSQRSHSPLHPSTVFVKNSPSGVPLSSAIRSFSPFHARDVPPEVPNNTPTNNSKQALMSTVLTSTFNGSTNGINGVDFFATAQAESHTNINLSNTSLGQEFQPTTQSKTSAITGKSRPETRNK